MRVETMALAVVAASALAGCRASFEIAPSQATCLEIGGVVTDVSGETRTLVARHELELEPFPGAEILWDPRSKRMVAVPRYDVGLEIERGLQQVERVEVDQGSKALAMSPSLPVKAVRVVDPRAAAVRVALIVPAAILGGLALSTFTSLLLVGAGAGVGAR